MNQREGWAKPHGSTMLHYFRPGSTMSLCKRYGRTQSAGGRTVSNIHHWTETGARCSGCHKKHEQMQVEQRARREGEPGPLATVGEMAGLIQELAKGG